MILTFKKFAFVFTLIVVFFIFSIQNVYADNPDECLCGADEIGPDIWECLPCGGGGGGGEPECTGPNQCPAGRACCGQECIIGGCPGANLVCNSGTEPNGLCTAESRANCTCPGCSFVTDPETGLRRCSFPTPIQAQALCCVPIPPSCGTTCTQCAGGTQCGQCSAAPNQGYYCTCSALCGGVPTSCTGALDPVRCPPGSTPPPATAPPPPPLPPATAITGTIFNDPDNNCSNSPQPQGWDFSDPLFFYLDSWVRVNGLPTPLFPGQKSGIWFAQSGATYSNNNGGATGNTVTLSGIPAGYRCSDCNTGTCPTRTGVNEPSNGINFFITNQAVVPTPPPALSSWWQVKDGDVTTDGDIVSSVPSTQFFGTLGAGGFAGVPVFGGTFNLVLQNAYDKISAATNKWNVNTTNEFTRIFDYSYFENLVPDDVVLNDVSLLASGTGAATYSDGYQWYKVTGNHTISSDINLGSRKVILFVKSGNLNINSRINLDDDSGFFGAFVNGSIVVSPTLTGTPAIEGLYLTDTGFSTGAGTSLLHIRGSVASFGPITLGRNLSNNATAAELFEFAPDQVMLFPEKLKYKKTKWTEVAP